MRELDSVLMDPHRTPDGSTWGAEPGGREATETRLLFPYKPESENQSGASDSLTRMARRFKAKAADAFHQWTWLEWMSFFLPCVGWLRTYKWKKWLYHDFVAGISVGFMVVPQGMAYANSAGLPSVFGLYGAFLPCLVYSLLGTSRQLAVGPVAVTSLLINSALMEKVPCATAITNHNVVPPAQQECQDQYNTAAIQLAFIVACLYTGVGVLRMGWITKFLSHAVIGGFTTGAAITIGMGQAKYILGFSINMGSSTRLQDYLEQYFTKMNQLRWQEFIMGVTCMFMMICLKFGPQFWAPLRHIRSFGALLSCVIGICAVAIGKVDEPLKGGIKVVGFIPKGLPPWTANQWVPMTDPSFSDLIVTAIVVMFVDLLESTSIARALARKNGYELIYNREIIGLGLANFAGAMSNCYTTTGSFSRSAVNNNAGAKTPLAQFVCGWLVAFVLLFLTPVFKKLPFTVLGAIVIVSVASLVEYEQAIYLWKVSKLDLLVWLGSCLGTLFYSVEVGLAISIGLAIVMALYQSAFPHTAVLGKVGARVYRNVKQYPDAQLFPGILAFRIDAPLYFANVKALEDKIDKAMIKFSAWSQVQGIPTGLQFLILDMTPVHHADSMGLHFLEDLIFECKKRNVQLILANPGKSVARAWVKVKLPDLLGKEFVFVSVQDAVSYAQQRMVELGLMVKPPPSTATGNGQSSESRSSLNGSAPPAPLGGQLSARHLHHVNKSAGSLTEVK